MPEQSNLDVPNLNVSERIKGRFSRLLWDQVRPWAYLDLEAIEVTTFDGRTLRIANRDAAGAKDIMWNDYIEPFLRDLCTVEIRSVAAQARTRGVNVQRALRSAREELMSGIIRIYWTMADVHRVCWPRAFVTRRDTSEQVAEMMAFLDSCIKAVDR